MSGRRFASTRQQPKKFAFSSENSAEAQKLVAKYPLGRQASALIPLLDLAQRQHGGWLPEAAIRHVASLLDVFEVRAFEVASFYTMFNLSPRGNFLIQCCRTTPCWLRGGDELRETCSRHLKIELGETTPDGMFTLTEVECLGACVNGPVIQINDDYYEDLNPERLVELLDSLKIGIVTKTGSQNPDRHFSEPATGLTTLTSD